MNEVVDEAGRQPAAAPRSTAAGAGFGTGKVLAVVAGLAPLAGAAVALLSRTDGHAPPAGPALPDSVEGRARLRLPVATPGTELAGVGVHNVRSASYGDAPGDALFPWSVLIGELDPGAGTRLAATLSATSTLTPNPLPGTMYCDRTTGGGIATLHFCTWWDDRHLIMVGAPGVTDPDRLAAVIQRIAAGTEG